MGLKINKLQTLIITDKRTFALETAAMHTHVWEFNLRLEEHKLEKGVTLLLLLRCLSAVFTNLTRAVVCWFALFCLLLMGELRFWRAWNYSQERFNVFIPLASLKLLLLRISFLFNMFVYLINRYCMAKSTWINKNSALFWLVFSICLLVLNVCCFCCVRVFFFL